MRPQTAIRVCRKGGHRVIAICALLALTGACGGPPERATVGDPAPSFSLPALAGGSLESDSLAGKPVILNFWATWCAPCRKEIPELIELAGAADISIVGIALDEEGARVVQPFVDEFSITYPVALGGEDIFLRYDGFVVPHTVVLDASLTVVKIHRGPVTREVLEEDLRAAGLTIAPSG